MRYISAIVCAMITMSVAGQNLKVVVTNPADINREFETVEVPWDDVVERLPTATAQNIVVTDTQGKQLPSQKTADALIFQPANINPKSKATFVVTVGNRENYKAQTYGRLVPERMDDWAWENNRIAFRVYGPALEATGEVSNGIDVWVKRTPELIINKWYANGDYHTDHGEGLDFYKVGPTLGAGAMAPWVDGKLVMARNFTKAQLLDSGAIRTTVMLNYEPVLVSGVELAQQRIISLDANTNFNRITEIFRGDFDTLSVAAAIVKHGEGDLRKGQEVAYSQPAQAQSGRIHVAVINPEKTYATAVCQGHYATLMVAQNGVPLTYYNGAGWSKSGFPTADDWQKEVARKVEKINNPLKIKIR